MKKNKYYKSLQEKYDKRKSDFSHPELSEPPGTTSTMLSPEETRHHWYFPEKQHLSLSFFQLSKHIKRDYKNMTMRKEKMKGQRHTASIKPEHTETKMQNDFHSARF